MSRNEKMWPTNCLWPDPRYPQWCEYDVDDVTEREMQINWALPDIVAAGAYFESVKDETKDDGWEPEEGIEYWEDGKFDEELWQDDFEQSMAKLKLYGCKTAYIIEEIIGYDFADEHLLQQAFTRRSFAMEYGLDGCNEELEFFGDAALNCVLTRTMSKQYGRFTLDKWAAYYQCQFDEGEMSRIRSKFISKEYLAERAALLELDQYILYGSADKETENAKEDMIEAIIGAVAIDSDWDYDAIEGVIDRLLEAHIECPDRYLKKDMYEIFNSWHQKHFGRMPEYEVYRHGDKFACKIRFLVPENDKGVERDNWFDVEGDTRSQARSKAAEMAHGLLDYHGLWMNLADSGIEPNQNNSINQLQELYQKKYVNEPIYNFNDDGNYWHCGCVCDAFNAEGIAKSKTEAKKAAAFKMLTLLFQSAGIMREGWDPSFYLLVAESE